MSLYRTYRPKSFDDVVGQDHIITTLRQAVAQDRLSHAYLFAGIRGTGKTSTARILARHLLTQGLADETIAKQVHKAFDEGNLVDLTEIDAASNTGVDNIRDLIEKIQFTPVVITEYSDLQCPACKVAHELVTTPLIEQYGSKIRFEFHQFPLSSIHPMAMAAAEASECAADQGKFWEFVNLAYEKQDDLSQAALDEWGRELGLDEDLYGRCRASHIKRDLIEAEFDQGKAADIRGTPTYLVNGQVVPSTVEDLGKAIDEATTGTMQRL